MHFGSLKGERIRYREETVLNRSTYRTYMAIYSESCPVAVVYWVTAIYRAAICRFDRIFFVFNFRLLIRGNALIVIFNLWQVYFTST